MKAILIEDDGMLRKSLGFFLKMHKLEIVEFDNGEDALNYIKSPESSMDIVITDLNLPFAGGKQIIHAIRNSHHVEVPVIVLTASGVEATELESFELGANDFIAKPFSPSVLLRRIQNLVKLK